jgi:UDP-N-acetylglucosamine 4-epimerase
MNYFEIQAELAHRPKVWLITGVAGFIGSNLLESLLKLGQKVVGLDNFSTGYQRNLDEVRDSVSSVQWKNFNFIDGDIRNLDYCRASASGVHYVLHHAALGAVSLSIKNPVLTSENNTIGFLNMLVAARDANVKRFVYASSSSVYGDHPDFPKVEDMICKPLSPYAATKCMNELYADVFGRCYNLSSIGLRYFNIFGRRQDAEGAYAAVIPKWIASMIKGDTVYINGDGKTSRDFCYVDNVVQANILAAVTENSVEGNQIYNVALNTKTTLNQLFEMIRVLLEPYYPHLKESKPVYSEFRDGDVCHSQADISKIQSLLGYIPSHLVVNGLKETITWHNSRETSRPVSSCRVE